MATLSILLPIFWTLLALGFLAAIWGIFIERQLFQIRESTLAVLAPGSQSIRVLQIGDIHLAPWQRRKARWIKTLGNLKPDLVVNTGDNLGHPNAIAPLLACLDPLLRLPGVFVNGSNDYHAPTPRNPFTYLRNPSNVGAGKALDTPRLIAGLESHGWLNLNNQAGELTINGVALGFLGVDDAHEDLDKIDTLVAQRSSLAKTKAGIIGVTHAPYMRVIEAMAQNDAGLVFAGHTHGGQVCVPFLGALVTNCDLPTKYAKGISAWIFAGKAVMLSVVAGLGNSIYAPVRFACLPEVRLLTLVAKA